MSELSALHDAEKKKPKWAASDHPLSELRNAKTLKDVARLVGFSPSGLSFILYKLPPDKKYTTFEIPKRNGGKRRIRAPEPRLRLLQRRLATLLTKYLVEMGRETPPYRSLAHGFEKGRSIVTNARLHRRRRYVFNLDLADFFPSINFGRVRGFFIKDRHFQLTDLIATILAQIACFENELPQGSPCSPVISNLIGHVMDGRLVRFARRCKCTYSRYADDITFSTNRKAFPPEIGIPVDNTPAVWQVGDELRARIESAGFKINDKKTRMQYRGSRQVVTGLMVNEKVNIRQEYLRTARAMCHELFKTGRCYLPKSYYLPKKAPPLIRLGGMLAHIWQVKNAAALRDDGEKKGKPTATQQLYSRFLFYKNFVANGMPLIIPEGKTDASYLRCAIRYLAEDYPQLGEFKEVKNKKGTPEKKFVAGIKFMNFSKTVQDIMRLGGGTGWLKAFIESYEKKLNLKSKEKVAVYRHKPPEYPVIVLIDNDDGATQLFKFLEKKNFVTEISHKSTEDFYHLGNNLYLVKTPESKGDDKKSCIEDLFPSKLLKTIIDGKTFDPHKGHEESGKYGKAVFAKWVRENASTIDFSKFAPLLDRIVAVLDDYSGIRF